MSFFDVDGDEICLTVIVIHQVMQLRHQSTERWSCIRASNHQERTLMVIVQEGHTLTRSGQKLNIHCWITGLQRSRTSTVVSNIQRDLAKVTVVSIQLLCTAQNTRRDNRVRM